MKLYLDLMFDNLCLTDSKDVEISSKACCEIDILSHRIQEVFENDGVILAYTRSNDPELEPIHFTKEEFVKYIQTLYKHRVKYYKALKKYFPFVFV